MNKKYTIATLSLLSTSMTIAGCTDKNETEEEGEAVTHDSIASDWSATSMSYVGETISLPSEECEANDEGTLCYVISIDMDINESQEATINLSYTVTLNDEYMDDESATFSYAASVTLKDTSNTYGIILDNEDDFYGNLDCTLVSDALECRVEEDRTHQLTFSRQSLVPLS